MRITTKFVVIIVVLSSIEATRPNQLLDRFKQTLTGLRCRCQCKYTKVQKCKEVVDEKCHTDYETRCETYEGKET